MRSRPMPVQWNGLPSVRSDGQEPEAETPVAVTDTRQAQPAKQHPAERAGCPPDDHQDQNHQRGHGQVNQKYEAEHQPGPLRQRVEA